MSLTKFFLELLHKNKISYGYNTTFFDYAPILKKLNLRNTLNTEGKTQIIDLYPTVGVWSYELNKELNPLTHLLMEPHPGFRRLLTEMMEFSKKDNWYLSSEDPFLWESFSNLIGKDKIISPKTYPRDVIHPELLLTANVAYLRGEVLLLQWIQCVLNSNWAHQFGNVRMLVWCYQSTAAKLIAKPGEKHRSKSSLLAELAGDVEVIATTEPKKYLFSEEYLQEHNPLIVEPLFVNRVSKLDDFCLLDIRPRKLPTEAIEEWDYITKQLFIERASPLSQAINNLGPGAVEWFKPRVSKELWNKSPSMITRDGFIEITDHFVEWPFKPDIYEAMLIPSEE